MLSSDKQKKFPLRKVMPIISKELAQAKNYYVKQAYFEIVINFLIDKEISDFSNQEIKDNQFDYFIKRFLLFKTCFLTLLLQVTFFQRVSIKFISV
jgi:hypothetical protein